MRGRQILAEALSRFSQKLYHEVNSSKSREEVSKPGDAFIGLLLLGTSLGNGRAWGRGSRC